LCDPMEFVFRKRGERMNLLLYLGRREINPESKIKSKLSDTIILSTLKGNDRLCERSEEEHIRPEQKITVRRD